MTDSRAVKKNLVEDTSRGLLTFTDAADHCVEYQEIP